jgi:hypothetical protein
MEKPVLKVGEIARVLDARPDPLDFRDQMYIPTLVEVEPVRKLDDYLAQYPGAVPILDQGQEGACTGFGLAAVANFLLRTRRGASVPDANVSARMLYEMAKRYDEWPGEDYSGSSARGAMKGWNKHGVCTATKWPYQPGVEDNALTSDRAQEAKQYPLGAYFRVNHQDLVAMHAAITEVGALYATAKVHDGWQHVGADGLIHQTPNLIGGHAFAIVAYDRDGFWIQNSWGPKFGFKGFCKISYDDWLENGTDVWVARLGVPVSLLKSSSGAIMQTGGAVTAASEQFHELRPHIISIGNDGELRDSGLFATNEKEVESLFANDIPNIMKNWKKKRILFYAHGGLVSESSAIQRVAEYRSALLASEIYPISFIWKTDYWTTLKNMLADAFSRRRPEGILDSAKDFLLDRADDALEPIARTLTGKAEWDEMKENAELASSASTPRHHLIGGARKVLLELVKMLARPEFKRCEIHLTGHSAGAIFLGPFAKLLASPAGAAADGGVTGFGLKIDSCTLWAPACNVDFFKKTYGAVIDQIDDFGLFTLTDEAEQDDDCANIYHKSLLYLVSNAFESVPHVPLLSPGTPIFGMEKWLKKPDAALKKLLAKIDWVKAPNTNDPSTGKGSKAAHHGDFDDDDATVKSTLVRILGTANKPAGARLAGQSMPTAHTPSRRREQRMFLQGVG